MAIDRNDIAISAKNHFKTIALAGGLAGIGAIGGQQVLPVFAYLQTAKGSVRVTHDNNTYAIYLRAFSPAIGLEFLRTT